MKKVLALFALIIPILSFLTFSYEENKTYTTIGVITAIEESDDDDFLYRVCVHTSPNVVFIFSTNDDYSSGTEYSITFDTKGTVNPADDEIVKMERLN